MLVLLVGLSCISPSRFYSQNVSASLKGAIVDPQNAVVPGARLMLTNPVTGDTYPTTSSADGSFVFPVLPPAVYNLAVDAKGFQKYVLTGIALTAGEIRLVGSLKLSLGEATQTVQVRETATPLQLATGERSDTVTGTQLNSLALKGRDFFALAALVPGVVDVNAAYRDETSPGAFQGIHINGGREETKGFTVDGINSVDTGSNDTNDIEPNMDSIAEVKILTSNYDAEYGHSAGGLISVITKSGGSQFHGTGWEAFRNEALNANNFFFNKEGLPRPEYRYNIFGYSLGGPIYVPHKFNSDRSKLFFFVSQEWTKTPKIDYGSVLVNMPTTAERSGDFSQSFDPSGHLIVITDPTTGKPFPGNIIPPNRLDPYGQARLKFFPLPNYVDPNPANRNLWNYRAAASGGNNLRNDMVRIDANPTEKLHTYFRWDNDFNTEVIPYNDSNFNMPPWDLAFPGHGFVASATYIISPTMVNAASLGYSWDSVLWSPSNPAADSRSATGNIPQIFPNTLTTSLPQEKIDSQLSPGTYFSGLPVNMPYFDPNGNIFNWAPLWTGLDNFSWVVGNHQIKAGVLYDHADKLQGSGLYSWNGEFNFTTNLNNPGNTGNAFANAILGNFNDYSEYTRDIVFNSVTTDLEFYIQDDWRVTPKLTLDYGIRFQHFTAPYDKNHTLTGFFQQDYSRASAPLLYEPGLNSSGQRVAVDPATGATGPTVLIGQFVPGTGNPANGMRVGGVNGTPGGIYTLPSLLTAPRFGFAYDPTGKGTMVIRGGAGLFYDQSRALTAIFDTSNPPVVYDPTLYYGNIESLKQGGGVIGPSSVRGPAPVLDAAQPSTLNYSLGIQKELPFSTALDVAYVGSVSNHLLDTRNINEIPMFARFNPANIDPTTGRPLPDTFLTPLSGYGNIVYDQYAASSNYNSLQISAQRRFSHGFQFGASYTYSKALGIASAFGGRVSSYFDPRHRNYGPLSFDRTHVFASSYSYDLPNLGTRLNNGFVGAILDHWVLSGITTFDSGAPFTPSFSTTNGVDITGSSEGAYINVVGNPSLSKGAKTFYHNFNTQAFAMPKVGTFGNAGVGILRGPGVNNFDIALEKDIPLRHENSVLSIRTEFYNAFNHTQFTSLDTGALFNPSTGQQINGDFGAFTGAAPARIIAFTGRISF